jgi:hypothetical protein
MSTKSRRRANTSRRRLSMAAGALLAGAAIPIAAAGTAWADDDTITIAQAEKLAKAGDPVDISVNGKTIKDTCLGLCSANSGTVGEHNTAIAVGDNSDAETPTGDTHDTARATGGATADINYASNSTATATNGGDASINIHNTPATTDTGDHAVANGTDTTIADVELASDSSATAKGAASNALVTGESGNTIADSRATAQNGGDASVINDGDGGETPNITHDVATARGIVNDSPSIAEVTDSDGSSATATNTGSAVSPVTGRNDGAYVALSIDSRAIAVNPDSGAFTFSTTDSSNVVNNGQQYFLDDSHTHLHNGMP